VLLGEQLRERVERGLLLGEGLFHRHRETEQ